MINKEMVISEVLAQKEGAAEILMSFGLGCLGCPSAQMESIADAAEIHGIEIDALIEALNK